MTRVILTDGLWLAFRPCDDVIRDEDAIEVIDLMLECPRREAIQRAADR